MLKQACPVCKVVGILAILGCINWGLIGLLDVNLVTRIFGHSGLANLIYILIGISGVLLLLSFFYTCPKCKKN